MSFVFPDDYWTGRYWATDYWPDDGAVAVIPDVSFVNGLYVQITVTDWAGIPLGELAGELESAAWKLNEFSQARLVVANAGTATQLLQFGNRVFIEFDNGLPPWVGYLDPPRRWRYGSVTLTAYSGERLLSHRVTDRGRYFSQATAGSILVAVVNEQAQPAVVQLGRVWLGGGTHSPDYHFKELLEVIQDSLLRMEDIDYDVTGAIENGRLVLRANLYERKGFDLADCWLLEGHNMLVEHVEEQGPIVNEWFMAGAGTGWGATSRIYARSRDETSARTYGLRQAAEVAADVSTLDTLDARTARSLEGTRQPYVATPFMALNLAPAAFADYGVGDRVNIEMYSFLEGGFGGQGSTQRRVIGREFRPRDGGCDVLAA